MTTPTRLPRPSRGNRRAALRELLLHFLLTVPASGWVGTISKLELALYRIQARHRLPAVIPSGSGLARVVRAERATFEACGFTLSTTRMAEVRTIHIKPAG